MNLGTNKLSSPVYDSNSGHVFVGDMGGTLHSVTATGTVFGTAAAWAMLLPTVQWSTAVRESLRLCYHKRRYSETGHNAVYEFSTGLPPSASRAS